jgi:UDP-2-acetamido-2-deoxy-ribo-hexuluronate aminotransferase
MNVPFIDILRYEPGLLDSLATTTQELLKKGQFVGGPTVNECEAAIKELTGCSEVVGCANGTDAIQVALRAAGVSRDDVVLLPDMTFWATFEAVVNVGARPATIDVSKETLHLTLESVREGIEKFKPRALLMVHLYGWACPDTEAIRKLCESTGVLCIEDCAQAIGVVLNGKPLLAGAFLATTSFYPAKVLGASGDAGAIFCQSAEIAKRARQLINHGRTDHYEHGLIGWNSRLGAYEANFLAHAIPHLKARLDSRRHACARYRNEITNPHLTMLAPAPGVEENGYLSVAVIDKDLRPRFLDYLKANGIGFGTVYPGAMSEQSGAREELFGRLSHGHAQWIASSVVNLPSFAYITDEEISTVIKLVNAFK